MVVSCIFIASALPARDSALLKALARAWFEEVTSGRVGSLAEIARCEGSGTATSRGLIKLAFVAPRIAEAIAEGRAPIWPDCR